MILQQNAHTDFAGEQCYGIGCINGVTVEVPAGVYPACP
jgi:hypothetical protein